MKNRYEARLLIIDVNPYYSYKCTQSDVQKIKILAGYSYKSKYQIDVQKVTDLFSFYKIMHSQLLPINCECIIL